LDEKRGFCNEKRGFPLEKRRFGTKSGVLEWKCKVLQTGVYLVYRAMSPKTRGTFAGFGRCICHLRPKMFGGIDVFWSVFWSDFWRI